MVTFKDRSFAAKSPAILILAILSMVWISSQVGAVHGIPTTTTPFVVKITSPHKGQQVGVGHNVTLLGSSNYNASSKCQVSIIVDKKRPYQNTIPIGQGTDNYSQWKYTLSPTYTALTEGENRVTAKLTCNANPALTKSYSINLTGINQPPVISQPTQQQIAIKSNGTTSPLSSASAQSNSTLAQSNSTLAQSNSTLAQSNRANTTSIIPVSANSSSLIDPSSTHSSGSHSSGHSHTHHHSPHHTHHSSSSGSSEHDHSSSSGSSEHDHSQTHSGSESHNSDNGGHSGDSHHGGGGGHDFFHGAFSHFGG